ncbi:hypothetical protein ABZZ17_06330 [Streptomyces sp. NPDC006512]|uniref:hypothetical protein n=1 Tax=Streptomyces sp. NPDC006512 TaxID=3154307 RepID=UPI0033BA0859
MISEPELEGEWTSDRPAEVARPPGAGAGDGAGDGAGNGAGDGPDGGRGTGRPWLWALGGAVLASAVWAGTLVAQDRFSNGPPIAYRHAEDLCKEAPMKALGGVAGGFDDSRPAHGEGPALDWAYCGLSTRWDEGRVSYQAQLMVELHKKTDPGTEFGAGPGGDPDRSRELVEVQQVPGLGERALFYRHVDVPRLQVLDGGAVFTLSVATWRETDEPEPDEDAVTAAMIEDVRALMARLKK